MTKEQIFKMIEGRIDTMLALTIECIELIYNTAYNEAIEEAANECEQWDKGASPKSDIAPEIRKLKK